MPCSTGKLKTSNECIFQIDLGKYSIIQAFPSHTSQHMARVLLDIYVFYMTTYDERLKNGVQYDQTLWYL